MAGEKGTAMVDWSYYDKPEFKAINAKYLPERGEGETMATQIVTAVNKLVYKWYNDGDVFDNTHAMQGWANDLSSYANWLRKYAGAAEILDRIYNCFIESDYEDLLRDLADKYLDGSYLAIMAQNPKEDSIYEAEGPYRFEEYCDYDDDDDWEEEEYE